MLSCACFWPRNMAMYLLPTKRAIARIPQLCYMPASMDAFSPVPHHFTPEIGDGSTGVQDPRYLPPSPNKDLRSSLSQEERHALASQSHAASTSAAEQQQAPLPASVVQQWPGAALQPQHTCSMAQAEPLACSYSADGTFLAVGCRSGQVQIMNSTSAEVAHTLAPEGVSSSSKQQGWSQAPACTAVRWRRGSPGTSSKHVLWLARGSQLQMVHASSGQVLQTLDEGGNQVCALAVHPQGGHVASAGSDAQIRVYDEATGQPELTLAGGDGIHTAGHRLNIYSLCWSTEDPQVMLSGGWDKTVQVWDRRAGPLAVRFLYGPFICGDALDLEGDRILTGSWRGQDPLQLWDLGSGKLMSNLPFHQEEPEGCQLYAAKFGQGGHVACGGSGQHARAQVTRQRAFMSTVTDGQLATFSALIYDDDAPLPGTLSDFHEFAHEYDEDVGLNARLFTTITKDGGKARDKEAAVFVFMGTHSSRPTPFIKAQMKQNKALQEDKEGEDLDLMRAAGDELSSNEATTASLQEIQKMHVDGLCKVVQGLVIDWMRKLIQGLKQNYSGTEWAMYTTGHSLGASVAQAMHIKFADDVQYSCLFENPGVPRYWRDQAGEKGVQHWKQHSTDYVTYPNPINTTLPKIGNVKRLQLDIHNQSSGPHAVRCFVGSTLRVMMLVSVGNLALSAAGKTKGFWAAKVVSVGRQLVVSVFKHPLKPKKIGRELRSALKEDQAARDARQAEEAERVDDPSAKLLIPIFKILPPRARSVVITAVWAVSTVVISTFGYSTLRTGAHMADTGTEHNIELIAQGFNEEDGKPRKCTEMKQWPYHEFLKEQGMHKDYFQRVLKEGLVPFRATSYGLHQIMRRNKLLIDRARRMPGFEEGELQTA